MGSCYSNQIVFQDGQRLVPIYDRQMGDMVGLVLVDDKTNKKKKLSLPKFGNKVSRGKGPLAPRGSYGAPPTDTLKEETPEGSYAARALCGSHLESS